MIDAKTTELEKYKEDLPRPLDDKYVFVASNDKNMLPPTKDDLKRIEGKIDALFEYSNNTRPDIQDTNLEGSELLYITDDTSSATPAQKARIISLCLSSGLFFALSTAAITISSIDQIYRLLMLTLSLPPLGIAIACTIALFQGAGYDHTS